MFGNMFYGDLSGNFGEFLCNLQDFEPLALEFLPCKLSFYHYLGFVTICTELPNSLDPQKKYFQGFTPKLILKGF